MVDPNSRSFTFMVHILARDLVDKEVMKDYITDLISQAITNDGCIDDGAYDIELCPEETKGQ